MQTWQLQDAKSRFSELVTQSLREGPQLVTRRGEEAVVIVAAREFRRLQGGSALKDLLLQAPRGEPMPEPGHGPSAQANAQAVPTPPAEEAAPASQTGQGIQKPLNLMDLFP
jgi:antitoxin Phd